MILRALPTWLLTLLILPTLPKPHPWQGQRFTLRDWHEGQTPACRYFDYALWFNLAVLAVSVLMVTV